MFGEQPEPWVEGAPVDEPDDSDFDGSASGIVGPTSDALRELSLPSDTPAPQSPILRARTRATTNAPHVLDREESSKTLAEGTSDHDEPIAPSSTWRWVAAVGVVAAAAALVVVLATRGPKAPDTSDSPYKPLDPAAALPQAQADPVKAVDPPAKPSDPPPKPAEPAKPVDPPITPTVADAGSNSDGASVGAGSGSAKRLVVKTTTPPKRSPPPPPKKDPPPKWDPDELLPK